MRFTHSTTHVLDLTPKRVPVTVELKAGINYKNCCNNYLSPKKFYHKFKVSIYNKSCPITHAKTYSVNTAQLKAGINYKNCCNNNSSLKKFYYKKVSIFNYPCIHHAKTSSVVGAGLNATVVQLACAQLHSTWTLI